MERRHFLQSISSSALAATLTPPLSLASSLNLANPAKVDPLVENKSLFDAAMLNTPALIGFQGTDKEFSPTTLTIEGKVPEDIRGAFYRNGAALHERNGQRYHHLFEGDGMIQAFYFEDGKIFHQGKFVKTPKYQQEQKAGRFLYSGPDSKLHNALPVASSDTINTANTNVIPVNGNLWALWEAGSPVALSPKTLDSKGFVNLGKDSSYVDKLKGLAFSAHPKIEPNGDIWNFGTSPTGHIVLYHLTAKGMVRNVNLLKVNYRGGMLHDFLITDKHLLLILPSLSVDEHKTGFFNAIKFSQQVPMQVLVVDKNSLSLKKRFDLPAGFAFHYGNAWEESDGTIHFDASLYPNIDVLHHLSKIMKGIAAENIAAARTALYTLKPSGNITLEYIGENSEFPRVNDANVGRKNSELYSIGSTEVDLWSDTVSCYQLTTGKITQFVYGKDYLVEEHISVNPSQKEGDGYLLGTALHIPSRRTCLNVFKVKELANGPVCRAWLPYHLPLGFHGNFMAS